MTTNLSFTPAFAGTKNVYMQALDAASASSGWQAKGTWTVSTGNQPPQAVSVTPSSGSGLGPQAFQFLYSDPNGYADLASLYGRFNASASDVGACSFRYDRASNYIYLYNDAGTAWLGPVVLGNQLTNSQCTLGAGSTTPSGNNLTLNLTATFKTAFAGVKNTYMQAVDAASASSGWQTRGAWTVPPPLTITTASPLPSGAWGVAYSPLTLAATGGTPPYSWSKEDPPINGNLLPSGLSLSAGGVLSGTPTRGGQTYGFWIRVTDSLGATATKTFTLAIGPAVQPIYGPSRLEVGLSYMPFDEYDYDHPASSKFPKSCPPGSSIRSCFQTVLAELRAQGVSGVRIFFGLCGSDSTPLVNCGQHWKQVRYKGNLTPPNTSWIDRVKYFFEDVRNAGIQNITLTPVHVGGTLYSNPKSETRTPISPPGQPPIHCADAPETIYFYPGAPLGYENVGTPQNPEYHPINAGLGDPENSGYNCAPINPFFVGWQNQYDVINAMLAAAAEKQLTVSELDFEQELNIMDFPALARFIVDNAQGDSGQPNVRDALRYYMGLYGFDPGRVTWSAPWSSSTLAGVNCTSVYAGYARMMGADQIASAIGGGLIGHPRDPSPPMGLETGYLTCNGNADIMFQMPTYGTQPNILDVHLRPCVAQPGTDCVLNDAAAAVQSEARIDFDDIVNYIARFPSSATVMLGETHSNIDDTGGLCVNWPLNAPAETVAGFNQSALAGSSVVFRPWMQLQYPSGDCFKYPGNQRVNFQGSGPYTPTQQ